MPQQAYWVGTTGDFNDAANWSASFPGPPQVPTFGTFAYIDTGTVFATTFDDPPYLTVYAPAQLDLLGVTIPVSMTINVNGSSDQPVLLLQGAVTNAGYLVFAGTNTVPLSAANGTGSGTLVNTGAIDIRGNLTVAAAPGSQTPALINNGRIGIENAYAPYLQTEVIAADVSGTGKFSVGTYSTLEFTGGVGAGQTLNLGGGPNLGPSSLRIDTPASFGATIANFVAGDTITLADTPYTGASYAVTSDDTGTLTLFDGAAVTAKLNVAGVYSLSSFSFSSLPASGTGPSLTIGTSVQNAANGSRSPSTAAGPVYRFFDSVYGTHFFTADSREAASIEASRSDLIQETNGFGDVQSTDLNAVAVFRFFDTDLGTHFFTSSLSERDATVATRPDLTYEPSATFYEHAVQQTGDTPVYRFFDNANGTHFYTGDAGEYAGIVTPGTAAYRPNLVSEGVSFYAPTGTFL